MRFLPYEKGGLWLTDTEINNVVIATDQDAQYDDKAKRLLGNTIILAHILVKAVDEFRGMNPKDVVSYIKGEPFISVVPAESGLTNVEKEEKEHDERCEMHRLLSTLLSMELTVDEKLGIIEKEYRRVYNEGGLPFGRLPDFWLKVAAFCGKLY